MADRVKVHRSAWLGCVKLGKDRSDKLTIKNGNMQGAILSLVFWAAWCPCSWPAIGYWLLVSMVPFAASFLADVQQPFT